MAITIRKSPTAWVILLAAVSIIAGCSAGAPTETGSPPLGGAGTENTTALARCDQSDAKVTEAYRTIPGVDPDLTSVDVYPVAGDCSAPVVMWVHGGGYRTGDKSNQMRDKVKLLNDQGWMVVSVNYRLTKPGQAGSAQFPDHYDDVASAVAWVHDNIASFGGDPSRIALLGHSAGADIVSNVATNPTYLQAHGLDLSMLRCAGPLDTEGFDKQAAGANDPDGEKDQWSSALGNNPDYLTATSATGLIKPIIGIPPMIGVVRGTPERQKIETAFLDALRMAGIEATTIDARSLTHSEVNSNIGASGDTVMTAPVVAFLTECFR